MSRPTMYFLVGPNGAGKSTLYDQFISPHINAPFINPDIIQKEQLDDQSVEGAYAAAKMASAIRHTHLDNKTSFVTESTFSHETKVDLVKEAIDADFRVAMFHVSVNKPELCVVRVEERVKEGGHNVPDEKILKRYIKNQPLIREAMLLADRGYVYDNSATNEPPRLFLEFRKGVLIKIHSTEFKVPQWIYNLYKEEINKY